MTSTTIPHERDITTECLEAPTPDYLPRDARPLQLVVALIFVTLAIGIYTRSMLFSAGFAAGWAARELAGGLWEQRGWAALVVFSIVGSVVIVHGRNQGR